MFTCTDVTRGASVIKKTRYSRLLRRYRTRTNRLLKRVEALKKYQSVCNKKCTLPTAIIENVSKYLKGFPLDFLKTQIELSTVKPKGRRYTDTIKSFSLALYFSSTRGYKLLSKLFALPNTRTIRYWVSCIRFSPGWNDCVFEFLGKKCQNLDVKDKTCGLVFDAISLKSGIYYNTSKDQYQGLEDMGDYGKSDKCAQYAMVFMVKGLCTKFKQALGYFFFHQSIRPDTLKSMITDCLFKLKQTGLTPKFVVCDQDVTNQSVMHRLGISSSSPFILNESEKVYFFYDTPHLMKSMRNNLINHNIFHNGNTIRWKYIQAFYEADKKLSIRLAPKLSHQHIYCNTFDKMRASLATQTFSRTVAAGISTYCKLKEFPREAMHTAEFINNMDQLFDIFNAGQKYHYKEKKCAMGLHFFRQGSKGLLILPFHRIKNSPMC